MKKTIIALTLAVLASVSANAITLTAGNADPYRIGVTSSIPTDTAAQDAYLESLISNVIGTSTAYIYGFGDKAGTETPLNPAVDVTTWDYMMIGDTRGDVQDGPTRVLFYDVTSLTTVEGFSAGTTGVAYRLFALKKVDEPRGVPDSGSAFALLGAAMLAIVGFRSRKN